MDFYINEDTAWLRRAVSWVVNIVVVLACAWFLVYGYGGQVEISGNSMQPVLDADDVVLVNRLIYDVGKPERFDIVVFEREDHKKNVKRIIGLPGDTVDIIDGKVYLNGSRTPLDEPYIREPMDPELPACFEVPEDSYFMMGDNRNFSADARRWENKYVKRDKIIAKVLFRYYPGIGKIE